MSFLVCRGPIKTAATVSKSVWIGLAVFAAIPLAAPRAEALPSYARQTGQECAACHNGFPELTPYGRLFKLNGYTFAGGTSNLPPLAVMLVPSFTHTQAAQQPGAAEHFGPNNNIAPIQSGSLFYGGTIAGKAACEDLCFSAGSHTCATGPIRNPHNLEHSTGGSSGGTLRRTWSRWW